jgi:hypothetical protein
MLLEMHFVNRCSVTVAKVAQTPFQCPLDAL